MTKQELKYLLNELYDIQEGILHKGDITLIKARGCIAQAIGYVKEKLEEEKKR